MKYLFNLFILAAFLMLGTGLAGTAVKREGKLTEHNYVRFNLWDFDTTGVWTQTGASAGTNTDTLILLLDSSAVKGFQTTSLRARNISTSEPDVIPDSIKYCVLAEDDAVDAVTLYTEYQVKWGANHDWSTIGGKDSLALAGSGVDVFSCFKQEFIPAMEHRLILHPGTTTDTARVFEAYIVAPRK